MKAHFNGSWTSTKPIVFYWTILEESESAIWKPFRRICRHLPSRDLLQNPSIIATRDRRAEISMATTFLIVQLSSASQIISSYIDRGRRPWGDVSGRGDHPRALIGGLLSSYLPMPRANPTLPCTKKLGGHPRQLSVSIGIFRSGRLPLRLVSLSEWSRTSLDCHVTLPCACAVLRARKLISFVAWGIHSEMSWLARLGDSDKVLLQSSSRFWVF